MCNDKLTGYRRFDIWLAPMENNIEPHYVIIVSNYKNNIKADAVTCCMITSTLKKHPAHVDIEGFGLKEKSQIKCEKIFTIEKEKLIKKVGNINDIYMQLKIQKALECQLQLKDEYIDTDTKQLEEFLSKAIKKVDNESKCLRLKNEICNLYLDEKYKESIKLCDELIESAKNLKTNSKCEYLWHAWYHKSISFSKLQNYKIALICAKESLKFSGTLREGLNSRYTYSIWSTAKCYENLKNGNLKAIEIYKNLSKYYKQTGKVNLRIAVICNIAKLTKKPNRIKNLINITENIIFTERETDKNKQILINDMKKDYLEITSLIN